MPPTLKVNGLDLSSFINVQADGGLDPADDGFLTPQFGGAPALAEGGVFVASTTRNKEWTVPLWLNSTATGAQGVDDLVEQVNGALQRGPAAVEFRPEGASQSTFFDLEAGVLSPKYSHFHHRKGWVQSDLKLYTQPYGHTATMRTVVPSQVWGGTQGPLNVLATGLTGDVQALANFYSHPSQAGAFMYGITPLPSFNPFIGATRFRFGNTSTVALSGSVIQGALRKVAAPPAATMSEMNFYLGPGDYCGRNRIFLLVSHNYSPASGGTGAVQLNLVDETFDALNPVPVTRATQLAPAALGALTFGLLDMGEVTVASQVAGAAPAPTTVLALRSSTTYPTYSASYPLLISGAVIVPLDHAAGIIPSYSSGINQNLTYRTWPQREARGNAFAATSVSGFGPSAAFGGDLMKVLRGDVPRMPKGATQARIMAYAHSAGGALNTTVQGMTVQLDVLERFKFVR